jgi:membrane-associated protein
MDGLADLIVSVADSPSALAVLFLLVVVDGFFPPVPSESVIIALASIGAATGAPNLWVVLLVAMTGSFIGDNIAFTIGRGFTTKQPRWVHRLHSTQLMERSRGALEQRPASVILTARFIPVGRVAVNIMAGSTTITRRHFLVFSAVSGLAWASYSVLIGVIAGAWAHEQPLLGVGVGIITAMILGVGIDIVSRRLRRDRTPTVTACTATSEASPAATRNVLEGVLR